MRKLLLAVLAVALCALPAYASVQNIKVSGDIDSSYVFRRDFNFGATTEGESVNDHEYQSLFMTQTRLRVDADLTDNVAATVALINERIWTNLQTSASTDIDLNLAYVTLREMLYSPLTLVIGRQDFRYGNSFIIDSAGPNHVASGDSGLQGAVEDLSKQSAFDAIRAILDYSPLKVELAYVELSPRMNGAGSLDDFSLDHSNNGKKLYGGNATYEFGDDMNSLVEAYVWYKIDKSNEEVSGTQGAKADTVLVKGLRGSITPIDRLNLQLEYAIQTGTKRLSDSIYQQRRAHAVQAMASFQLPLLEEYMPVLTYSFTKATGESDDVTQKDGVFTAWDVMFENQATGKIYNTLFQPSNYIMNEVTLSAVPMEDLSAALSLSILKLERKLTSDSSALSLVQPDDDDASVTDELGSLLLGKEIDLVLKYDYTEDVQLGANMGWFFPGTVFKVTDDPNSNAAKQLILNCLVKF